MASSEGKRKAAEEQEVIFLNLKEKLLLSYKDNCLQDKDNRTEENNLQHPVFCDNVYVACWLSRLRFLFVFFSLPRRLFSFSFLLSLDFSYFHGWLQDKYVQMAIICSSFTNDPRMCVSVCVDLSATSRTNNRI